MMSFIIPHSDLSQDCYCSYRVYNKSVLYKSQVFLLLSFVHPKKYDALFRFLHCTIKVSTLQRVLLAPEQSNALDKSAQIYSHFLFKVIHWMYSI